MFKYVQVLIEDIKIFYFFYNLLIINLKSNNYLMANISLRIGYTTN